MRFGSRSNIGLLLAALSVVMAAPLAAQTRITADSVAGATSATGRVWVVMPSGVIAEADLVGITLDLSGSRPVLRAVPPPPSPVLVDKAVVINVSGDTGTFTLPDTPAPESLHVYRNGLLMAVPGDYTTGTDGKSVTFTAFTPRNGDIVQLRYRMLQPQ